MYLTIGSLLCIYIIEDTICITIPTNFNNFNRSLVLSHETYKLIIESKISFSSKGKRGKGKFHSLLRRKAIFCGNYRSQKNKSDNNLKIHLSRMLYGR